MNRIIFITDIHNNYKKFINLLKEHNYDEETDYLILGGDYFDRGKEPRQMAQWLIDNYRKENVFLVRGNHDDFMIDLLNNKNSMYEFNYKNNGLKATVRGFIKPDYYYNPNRASARIKRDFPELKNALESLLDYVELEGYIFTHASLPEDFRNADESAWQEARWANSLEWSNTNEQPVYIGHWILSNSKFITIRNTTFCDTGMYLKENKGAAKIINLK